MTEIWLDEHFSELWQGKDVFACSKAINGETYRQLEQRQTLAFSSQGRRYFIKRHGAVPFGEIIKNLLSLRLPVVSARNEYRAILAMQKAGIQVPRVAAYGRRGLLPSRYESFLVTHDVGPHQTLEDYCRHWADQPPDYAGKIRLISQIADISRRMHGAGICHRDFYLCHFLRQQDSDALTVIDLHRALLKTRLGQRWIIKDLAGLYFSAMDAGLSQRDLLRFVRAYRQQRLQTILGREAGFWRRVSERAKRMYRRHQAG